MIVAKKAAAKTKELIAWLKANPTRPRRQASAQAAAHMSRAFISGNTTETKFQFVFYRGGAPAMQDMVAGTHRLSCAPRRRNLAQVPAGKMKAFAVMAQERYAGRRTCRPWRRWASVEWIFHSGTVWAKGMPPDVVGKLNAAAVKALADPIVRIAALGMSIPDRTELPPQGCTTPEAELAGPSSSPRHRNQWSPLHQVGRHQVATGLDIDRRRTGAVA